MALTAVQQAYYRTRIGTPLDEADLESRLARLGTDALVATEVLEERIATLLTKPLQFSVPGEYSEDRKENMTHLRDMLEQAQAEAGVTPAQSLLNAVQVSSRWSR